MALPWAVLRAPSGDPQADRDHQPAARPRSRPRSRRRSRGSWTCRPAEADGARDEAKRAPPAGARAGHREDRVGRGLRRPGLAAQAAAGADRTSRPRASSGSRRSWTALLAQRPEVIRRIATAREHGDLKENAEYHAAREEQGFLEGRIKSLEAKLKIAVVVAPTERGAVVELGLEGPRRGGRRGDDRCRSSRSAEANSREGRISSVSPVGAALMGRKVGDAVTIVTPGGEIRYEILEIS